MFKETEYWRPELEKQRHELEEERRKMEKEIATNVKRHLRDFEEETI